jgi:ribosomal protein S18 acetylase RimI-like enzyme
VGTRLLESFLAEARRRRLPGVRAVVYESNGPARRFFERQGFEPLGRQPAFKPPPEDGNREWKIVYGKDLR